VTQTKNPVTQTKPETQIPGASQKSRVAMLSKIFLKIPGGQKIPGASQKSRVASEIPGGHGEQDFSQNPGSPKNPG
jgi:hypothetical protein